MKAHIVTISPAELEQVFPLISQFIMQGIEQSDGRVDIDSFCHMVADGSWLLWGVYVTGEDEDERPVFKGVVASELLEYPSGVMFATVPFTGGFDADEWAIEVLTFLEGWATKAGAVRMEIFARRGWSKLLHGYRCKNLILEKKLGKTDGKPIRRDDQDSHARACAV